MPKKSYKQLARKRQERRNYLWQALQRNPAFKNFREAHFEEIRADIEFQKELDAGAPPQLHSNYDPEYQVLQAFLQTPKGRRMAARRGLVILEKSGEKHLCQPAVKVIPHQKARRVGHLTLDFSTYLRNGHILTLSLDLSAYQTHLLAGVDFQVKRYKPLVPDRKERVSPLNSTPGVLSWTRQGRRYLLVDLHLHASPEKIRLEVRRLLPVQPVRGPKQGRRLYPRKASLWDVWSAYDKHKSFRRGSWSLGIPEDTFRKAYYRAFAEVTGEPYRKHTPVIRPGKFCLNCPKRTACEAECPEVLAYVNQDKRSLRATLGKETAFESSYDPRDEYLERLAKDPD